MASNSTTSPPIAVAQNRPDSQRLVAAQARLYSDTKRAWSIRFCLLIALSLALAATSIITGSANVPLGAIGGIVLLFGNGLFMYRERRRAELAVAVQEKFDTEVYQLPWNDLLIRERPSGQEIAKAADRYDGGREQDWYPATGTVHRPFDVLICQQSNVGWGAPVHRAWAWTVIAAAALSVLILGALRWVIGLSLPNALDALVLPFLPILWEGFETVRTNFESARGKESTQSIILGDWADGLRNTRQVTEARVRGIQDEIVSVRRQNAHVPDFFDRWLRSRNESAMRATASDMLAEAQRYGKA